MNPQEMTDRTVNQPYGSHDELPTSGQERNPTLGTDRDPLQST